MTTTTSHNLANTNTNTNTNTKKKHLYGTQRHRVVGWSWLSDKGGMVAYFIYNATNVSLSSSYRLPQPQHTNHPPSQPIKNQ